MPDCHLENLSVHFSPEILCRILSRTVPSHQKVHFGDVLTLLTNPSDNPPTQNRPGGPNFCGHMSMSTSQRSSTPHCLILTLRRILSVDPDVQSRVRHWTFRWFLFSRDYGVEYLPRATQALSKPRNLSRFRGNIAIFGVNELLGSEMVQVTWKDGDREFRSLGQC